MTTAKQSLGFRGPGAARPGRGLRAGGWRAFLVAVTIGGFLFAPRGGFAQPAPGKPGPGKAPTLARPRPPIKGDAARPDRFRPAKLGEPGKGAPPPPPPARPGDAAAGARPGVPTAPGAGRPGLPVPGRPGVPGAPGAAVPLPAPGGRDRDVPGEREFNECRKVPANRKIKLTLKPESELADLVGWISGMTCRRFILPSNVRSQKVTIVAPEPVSAAEAYRLFLSALATMGLTVEATGGFLRIIESNRGKESNVQMCAPDEDCPHDDRFVTRMLRLRHVSADEMMAVLNRLKSKDADIIAYQPSNTLIISEWGSNLRRLVEIVDALDIGTAVEKIFWIKLKYAYATEVAGKLQEIFQIQVTGGGGTGRPTGTPAPSAGRTGPGGRPAYGAPAGLGGEAVGEAASELSITRIVPDDRTHSLILVCTEKAFERIRVLVHKIDVPPALGRQRIHVYYLANANADEMAGVLQGLVSGSGGRPGTTGARPGATGSTGRPGQTPTTGASSYGSTGYGASGAGGGYGMGQQGQFQLFESPISISSDKGTNALVIIATMEDFLQLREVIHKLDRPRRQVFVEAVILEVSLDRALDLGTSWHGGNTYDTSFGKQSGTSLLFGGSITNQSANSILLSPSALSGLAVGFRGPEIPNAENLLGIPGLSLPAFGVFFQALQTNNDVNVLSAPHILTTDNEKAEITVGQNLPFQGAIMGGGFSTGTTTGAAGAAASSLFPSISVQRQDVALKLALTPHVNEGDFVRIELDQEVSDIASQNFNGLGPATSKRTAKTVVVCKDTQTVVIGGLMSERQINAETKVPLLGDLPILGYLFKSTKKTTQKTNLLIFLTPYIIKDQNDLKSIFERKLRERREFMERYTSFRDKDYAAAAVYRTRRGMLAELERTARMAEDEARLLGEAEKQLERSVADEGPIMDAPPSATRKGGALVPSGTGTPAAGTAPRQVPTRPAMPARPAPVRGGPR
jgi:general secretion pathway protein D